MVWKLKQFSSTQNHIRGDPWFDRGGEERQTIFETAEKPNVWKYSRCVVV